MRDLIPHVDPGPSRQRIEQLLRSLAATLGTAQALAPTRRLDLSGLPERVGQVCAMVLDLPHQEARSLAPALNALLQRVDGLTAALRAPDHWRATRWRR